MKKHSPAIQLAIDHLEVIIDGLENTHIEDIKANLELLKELLDTCD